MMKMENGCRVVHGEGRLFFFFKCWKLGEMLKTLENRWKLKRGNCKIQKKITINVRLKNKK